MQSNNPTGSGKRRMLLGEITTVHGIRGEVVVRSYTADPAAVAGYGPLETEDGSRSIDLTVHRVTPKGGVIASVRGIADRTAAEKLRGTKLFIARDKMPEPEPGFYYHEDLVGLTVVSADGAIVGRVAAIHNFGAGDIVEVRLDGRKETELFPFTNAVVPNVDIAAGRLTLVPPMSVEGEPSSVEEE